MAIDINKHFGREVRKNRKLQNMSQLRLAELAKTDLSTINRMERGIANITLRNAFKVTKHYIFRYINFFLLIKK